MENPVAPLAGAWIEIIFPGHAGEDSMVAPLAGAWIEIPRPASHLHPAFPSLPLRERGLKSLVTL